MFNNSPSCDPRCRQRLLCPESRSGNEFCEICTKCLNCTDFTLDGRTRFPVSSLHRQTAQSSDFDAATKFESAFLRSSASAPTVRAGQVFFLVEDCSHGKQ